MMAKPAVYTHLDFLDPVSVTAWASFLGKMIPPAVSKTSGLLLRRYMANM